MHYGMCVFDFPPFHRRILDVALTVCDDLGLYLAGGYAVKAHGLVERPSQDLDFATDSLRPLPEIIEITADTYRDAGFDVVITRGSPRMGQILVTDPMTEESCKVDFLKEPLQKKPVLIGSMRVVALDDLVGMKATALASRAAARDFIDVSAAARIYPFREIERLIGLRNGDEGIHPRQIVNRLEWLDGIDDDLLESYGLDQEQIREIRRFAVAWADEIKQRRAADGDADSDWEPDIAGALYED